MSVEIHPTSHQHTPLSTRHLNRTRTRTRTRTPNPASGRLAALAAAQATY